MEKIIIKFEDFLPKYCFILIIKFKIVEASPWHLKVNTVSKDKSIYRQFPCHSTINDLFGKNLFQNWCCTFVKIKTLLLKEWQKPQKVKCLLRIHSNFLKFLFNFLLACLRTKNNHLFQHYQIIMWFLRVFWVRRNIFIIKRMKNLIIFLLLRRPLR